MEERKEPVAAFAREVDGQDDGDTQSDRKDNQSGAQGLAEERANHQPVKKEQTWHFSAGSSLRFYRRAAGPAYPRGQRLRCCESR